MVKIQKSVSMSRSNLKSSVNFAGFEYQSELICIDTKAWPHCGETFNFLLPDLLRTGDCHQEWWLPHPYLVGAHSACCVCNHT
jgi:hypothetical protein